MKHIWFSKWSFEGLCFLFDFYSFSLSKICLFFFNTMCKDLKVLCDTTRAIQKITIWHSLCKQNLCSTSLSKCIWCLPARVKLWTLLKHSFSQITCIFLYIMTKVFVHLSVNLILETIALLLIWMAFSFLMNLEFCLWKTISDSVLINIFFMTELQRIKECSPIPLSYLLNSVYLTSGSKSVSSVWATTSI